MILRNRVDIYLDVVTKDLAVTLSASLVEYLAPLAESLAALATLVHLEGLAVLVAGVDEADDPLDAGPPRQAADGRLGDALEHMVSIEESVDSKPT
jgi:hypothetical protein